MNSKEDKIILKVENLKKYFDIHSGLFSKEKNKKVLAVDGISFQIKKGETFGLVGESGCGKTTCGRTILRLYEPTSGKIYFNGKDISKYSYKELLPIRKQMQMIFQDPYSSLNGRMTVKEIISEPLEAHSIGNINSRQEIVYKLLNEVGLKKEHASRYPHEFSGGQRQRIGIARSLAVDPEFIICDEPISALDVSIQAQIVNMLEDFQNEKGLTYLFIAHDLSMVRHLSHKIGVMYLGQLMETSTCEELYQHSVHPYTQALLSAVPYPDPKKKMRQKRIMLEGEVPSALNPPKGCRFCTRCKYAKKICFEIKPELKEVAPEHFASCHLI